MIAGTGVDLLDIRRIEGISSRQSDRFFNRIFTKTEQDFCNKRLRKIESFAKMFAIKEAVIKAISVTSGIKWHDIEISHNENGKPVVNLKNKALSNLLYKIHNKSFVIEVSVSDEIPYVCAFVVIDAF